MDISFWRPPFSPLKVKLFFGGDFLGVTRNGHLKTRSALIFFNV